jgi:hypothetical protein
MQIRETIPALSTSTITHPGSSSSWEMTVPRKELNMQVVKNIGGLFAGDR